MRGFVIGMIVALNAGTAFAADTCMTQATGKHLSGAALQSFMSKCQKDAQSSCNASAAGKKLSGAAKTSFTKKCISDAVGQKS
jgi:hypothetical protein